MNAIRVTALCVLRRGDAILVFEAFDSMLELPFFRPLGGGVEMGETAAAAATREIREEIGRDVADLRLLGTLENIFTLEGRPGHEIVFVYEGAFADPLDYDVESFDVVEADGTRLKATWRPLSFFDGYHRLVPEGIGELLDERAS